MIRRLKKNRVVQNSCFARLVTRALAITAFGSNFNALHEFSSLQENKTMSKRSSDSEDSDPKQLAVRQNVQFGKFGDFADEFEPDIVILFHDLKEAAAKVMYVQEKSLSLQLFAEFLFDALHAPGEIVADDEEVEEEEGSVECESEETQTETEESDFDSDVLESDDEEELSESVDDVEDGEVDEEDAEAEELDSDEEDDDEDEIILVDDDLAKEKQ
jgi:hypothetical protein